MNKLANKIALASLLGVEEGMNKSASRLVNPVTVSALAGGLAGISQINEDDSPWQQSLKPALGALTGVPAGLLGGLVGFYLGYKPNNKLKALARKTKNKKAKAILTALATSLPTAGNVAGTVGAGALSGLGISKLIDL